MADDDLRVIGALLDLPPGASVLDVPCGDGRMTIGLAAAGSVVTGIDIAAEEVELARRSAARAGVDARFVVGDLRALPDVGRFDAVVSWGNSFGYLAPDDTVRSLAGMRRAVRPGGRLLLESATVAESLLLGGIRPVAEHAFGGVRMTSTNHYNAAESRLESEYVFEDGDGNVERSRAAHHVHTVAEVGRLLRGAGFHSVELRGADGTEPYTLGSRLIALATA